MKLKVKLCMSLIGVTFLLFNCKKTEPIVSENIQNSRMFFGQLTSDGGKWVYHPNDSTIPFESFNMKFQMNGKDTLIGHISGVHNNGNVIPFWEVKEAIDQEKDVIIFEQTGSMGKAESISTFPEASVRKAEFEIEYVDDTMEKHRDVHTIVSENEILTESEIYDNEKGEWVKQPSAVWKKKMK